MATNTKKPPTKTVSKAALPKFPVVKRTAPGAIITSSLKKDSLDDTRITREVLRRSLNAMHAHLVEEQDLRSEHERQIAERTPEKHELKIQVANLKAANVKLTQGLDNERGARELDAKQVAEWAPEKNALETQITKLKDLNTSQVADLKKMEKLSDENLELAVKVATLENGQPGTLQKILMYALWLAIGAVCTFVAVGPDGMPVLNPPSVSPPAPTSQVVPLTYTNTLNVFS